MNEEYDPTLDDERLMNWNNDPDFDELFGPDRPDELPLDQLREEARARQKKQKRQQQRQKKLTVTDCGAA